MDNCRSNDNYDSVVGQAAGVEAEVEAAAMKAASTTSLRISVVPKIGETDISCGSLFLSLPAAPEVVGFPEVLDRRRFTGAKKFLIAAAP